MSLSFWVVEMIQSFSLIVLQIVVEIILYYRYKKKFPADMHSYRKFLDYCYKQSVFNQEVGQIAPNHQIHELNPQNVPKKSKQSLQTLPREYMEQITLRNELLDEHIEEEADQSQLNSSSQLQNSDKQQSDDQQSIPNAESQNERAYHNKTFFYLFYFALSICLPFSILKTLLQFFQEAENKDDNPQDLDKPIIQIYVFIRITTDLENFFDYFCFLFVALMIQSQGIFVKLVQDYYRTGENNMVVLVKCQIQRALTFVVSIFLIQQVFNVYFYLTDQENNIQLVNSFFYTIVFLSFLYKGRFVYSNEKIQKDQILQQYYNTFYEKHFKYQDLVQEYQKMIRKSKGEFKREDFRQFLQSKMYISIKELKIKQVQLETNHEFKDIVYNQGINEQIQIKLIFYSFNYILPAFLLFVTIEMLKCVLSSLSLQDFNTITSLQQYYSEITKSTGDCKNLTDESYSQVILQIFDATFYILLIFLKYFTRQSVFFNATAHQKSTR